MGKIKFGIKVVRFTRTSFERQILESVVLQENRDHYLLNSKSEYNRCAIPRLASKMGENEYKRRAKEEKEEKMREEEIQAKVRKMRKERNRRRRKDDDEEEEKILEEEIESREGNVERRCSKKRKIEDKTVEVKSVEDSSSVEAQIVEEFSAVEVHDAGECSKTNTGGDGPAVEDQEVGEDAAVEAPNEERESMKNRNILADDEEDDPAWLEKIRKQEEMLARTLENEGRRSEWIDWDERFAGYRKELEKEENETTERVERAAMKTASWELMRLCRNFVKENGTLWKDGEEERKREKDKRERLSKVAIKKDDRRSKMLQKKLTETWLHLPEKERERYRGEEERRKRFELKEIKENLWRWRSREGKKGEKKGKGGVKKKEIAEEIEKKIEEIEKVVEKIKEEDKLKILERERIIEERRIEKARITSEKRRTEKNRE